jgi:Leucine-rich repeat (LRR) protein
MAFRGAGILLFLSLFIPEIKVLGQTNAQDSLVLVTLYNATNGPSWSDNTNWLSGSVDTWTGVTVVNKRVAQVYLSGNNLSGPLPSSLSTLLGMTDLDLSFNALTGTIPTALGSLVNLNSISLSNNNLTGAIPALNTLSNLTSFDFSNNSLSGIIPAISSLTNLSFVDLSNNTLQGPLPASLFTLSNIYYLALHHNQIADSLRNSIYGLQSLEILDLSNNQFAGTLPDSLFSIPTLSELNLSNNQFTGELSKRITGIPDLYLLDLSNNRFECRIPSGLGNLTHLTTLNLNGNGFDMLDPLTGLFGKGTVHVNVSNNQLQFGDIESNMGLSHFTYAPQDSLYFPVSLHYTTDQLFDQQVTVSGSSNTYQWYKDGTSIPGETNPEIQRGPLIPSDAGKYSLVINSSAVPGLTLYRKAIFLSVSPCLTTVSAQDSLALVAIYQALGGSGWSNKSGWLSAPLTGPSNSWDGVATDCGHVITLNLAGKNAGGNVPTQIGNLTFLSSLDLSNNPSITSVPTEMGNLTNLQYLDLSNISLGTSLPSWITNLTSLTTLNMSSANLSGSLPDNISNLGNLQRLHLPYNKLSGLLPGSICELTPLTYCNLGQNNFSGTIPDGFCELINLTELDLDGSPNLTGSIPSDIGNLVNLQFLHLGSDHLTGTLPASITSLANLQQFFAPGNALTGDLPADIGSLSSLTDLHLNDNQFTGALPTSLYNCSNLLSLDLSQNQLAGIISSLSAGWSSLQTLDLYQNQFSGIIPSELGSLPNLNAIDLSINQLTGSIPPEFGQLNLLADLRLSSNQLSGPIPPELGNLPNLQVLYLDHNSLNDSIPVELGNLPALETITLASNQLVGPIPVQLSNDSQLGWIDFNTNLLTGTLPKEFSALSNLGILFLNGNQFTGSLPSEWSACSKLATLVVSGNQLTGAIPSSYSAFTQLYWLDLSNNSFTDSIPSFLASNTGLNYLFLSGNQFVYVPDFTSTLPQLTGVFLDNNRLTFESIEPYYKVKSKLTYGFTYAPQDSVGMKRSLNQMAECPVTFPANVGGSANLYQWYKNGIAVPGKTSASYPISALATSDAGSYTCAVTSSVVPGLTLNTLPVTISVSPLLPTTVSEDPNNPQCNVRTLIATPSGWLSYQWYLDGHKLVGETRDSLIAYYSGNYVVAYQTDPTTCVINSLALAVSDLYNDAPPVITASGSPIDGISTTYSAVSYQWYVNDKVIAGADSTTITVWYNGSYYLVANLPNHCQYRSNTIVVGESNYPDLGRVGQVGSDTVVLVPPDESTYIFPNPAQGIITVEAGSLKPTTITFFDNNSKLMFSKEFENAFDRFQLDISSWSPGIYIVSIGSEDKKIWRKLVKY